MISNNRWYWCITITLYGVLGIALCGCGGGFVDGSKEITYGVHMSMPMPGMHEWNDVSPKQQNIMLCCCGN